MNKENINRRLTQILMVLNPVLVLSFRYDPQVVMLMPLLTIVSEMIVEYFLTKKDITLLSKNLPSIKIQKKQSDTDAFSQICWSITKHADVSKLNLNGFYKGPKYDAIVDRNLPIYTIDDDFFDRIKIQK